MKAFLDTNILVYLYYDDTDKQDKAIEILNTRDCHISTQVLSEFSNVSFKKYKFTAQKIKEEINEICEGCSLALVTRSTVRKALDIKERYRYSYYDCLILASAIESECGVLYSEDMSDGQRVETVSIQNPFTHSI